MSRCVRRGRAWATPSATPVEPDRGHHSATRSEAEVARGPDAERLGGRDLAEQVARAWPMRREGLKASEKRPSRPSSGATSRPEDHQHQLASRRVGLSEMSSWRRKRAASGSALVGRACAGPCRGVLGSGRCLDPVKRPRACPDGERVADSVHRNLGTEGQPGGGELLQRA